MKVLIINGSPRVNGNTSVAVHEMEKIFADVEPAILESGKSWLYFL